MTQITTDDGVLLYVEETGSGTPIVFVHEYAGDCRSFEPQVRAWSRRYRCITFNARGYPPSDVPDEPEKYSQERARDDIKSVLDGLKIEKAHILGLSMGGFAALHFGFAYPDRALSLVVGGCGYGAQPEKRGQFLAETAKVADTISKIGMAEFAKIYSMGPSRVQHLNKDPRGFAEFARQLGEHSTRGAELTQRGVQARRPSLYDLLDKMRALTVPTLIMTGDEDEPCLEPGLLMKRNIKSAQLAVMPGAGHNINIEDSELFNRLCLDFFHQVESGRWLNRDPRSVTGSIMGVK
jgi:pimeloyl-ACP methyl ester carboxylesterase